MPLIIDGTSGTDETEILSVIRKTLVTNKNNDISKELAYASDLRYFVPQLPTLEADTSTFKSGMLSLWDYQWSINDLARFPRNDYSRILDYTFPRTPTTNTYFWSFPNMYMELRNGEDAYSNDGKLKVQFLVKYRGRRWKGFNVDLETANISKSIEIALRGGLEDVEGFDITYPTPTDTNDAVYEGLVRIGCKIDLKTPDLQGGHKLHTSVKMRATNMYGDSPEYLTSPIEYDLTRVYYEQLVPEIDLSQCRLIGHIGYDTLQLLLLADGDQVPQIRYPYTEDHTVYYSNTAAGALLQQYDWLWFDQPSAVNDPLYVPNGAAAYIRIKFLVVCKKVPCAKTSFQMYLSNRDVALPTNIIQPRLVIDRVTDVTLPGPVVHDNDDRVYLLETAHFMINRQVTQSNRQVLDAILSVHVQNAYDKARHPMTGNEIIITNPIYYDLTPIFDLPPPPSPIATV